MLRNQFNLPADVNINTLTTAGQRSDHDPQLHYEAKSVGQNLLGPYAIKKNLRTLPDGTPGNQWSLDLPSRSNGSIYTLYPNDTRKTNITPEELSFFTGKSSEWCAKLLAALLEDNKNSNMLNTLALFKNEKEGLGNELGMGGFRLCIETYTQFQNRMSTQLSELKASFANGPEVMCLQEQPYDLPGDAERKKYFHQVMNQSRLGYTQKTFTQNRDVGIWVKKGTEDNYEVLNDKLITSGTLRGCIIRNKKNRNVYINVHVDRCDSEKLVVMMEQMMAAAKNYAKPNGVIAIHGDFNLFQLDNKYVDRLRMCGYTMEPVKNTAALRKIINNPNFKPTYEAHTGLALAESIIAVAQTQPLQIVANHMPTPSQPTVNSTPQIGQQLRAVNSPYPRSTQHSSSSNQLQTGGTIQRLKGLAQNKEESNLASNGQHKLSAEQQAQRIYGNLLDFLQMSPDKKIGFIYSSSYGAVNYFHDSYQRNDKTLPTLSDESSGQTLLFSYLINLINNGIKSNKIEPGTIKILPIATIKYSYNQETGGDEPDNVSKEEIDEGLDHIKQYLDEGYTVYGLPRPLDKSEYSIGGGVAKAFLVKDREFGPITRNDYVQQALRGFEMTYKTPPIRQQRYPLPTSAATPMQHHPLPASVAAPMQHPQPRPRDEWPTPENIKKFKDQLEAAQRVYDKKTFSALEETLIAAVKVAIDAKGINNRLQFNTQAPQSLQELLKIHFIEPLTISPTPKLNPFANFAGKIGQFFTSPSNHQSITGNSAAIFILPLSRMEKEIEDHLNRGLGSTFHR